MTFLILYKCVVVHCSLIQYCVKAGSYRGPEITPEEDEVEDLIQRFSAVSLLDCGRYNTCNVYMSSL